MELKYYKEDDLLVIKFSDKPVDDYFDADNAILEVDKKNEPVSMEILHASKFFDSINKTLPEEIKKEFFTPA